MQNNTYIGVILAAGVGSRLRPMTNYEPKCLVKTAGKPILEYQMDAYRKAGINELVVIVGYEAKALRDYCKRIKDVTIHLIENADYEFTNNMYSFYLAKAYIKDRPFILNNADLALDDQIVKVMVESPVPSAVAVDTSVYAEESMKIIVNESGYICDISKSIPKSVAVGCSIDFYKFSAEDGRRFMSIVAHIIEEESNLKDWTEVALQRAFQQQTLKFEPIDIAGLRWVEIDSYEDLAIADRIFSRLDERLKGIEVVFLDLDGTTYVGNTAVPGAASAIDYLRENRKVFFLSNNSSRNKNDYVRKLAAMGIRAAEQEIILSTDGLLAYLKADGISRVHVLGTQSLKQIFVAEGFKIESDEPEYVILGYDTELTYERLVAACNHINRGVDYLATHCDVFCPTESGPIPDIGAMTEMIRMTTGRGPLKVFGKPSQEMVRHVVSELKTEPTKILFVGDRLYTDIAMAENIGAASALVLTGESSRDLIQSAQVQPMFIINSISDLTQDHSHG